MQFLTLRVDLDGGFQMIVMMTVNQRGYLLIVVVVEGAFVKSLTDSFLCRGIIGIVETIRMRYVLIGFEYY